MLAEDHAPPELAAEPLGAGLLDSEEAAAREGSPKEDLGLAAAALPYSTIKRIVRTVSPGVTFDREAIAGFTRIAQAFALFATDGALAELSKEAEKAKKSAKSKSTAPAARSLRTLTADHVMRFLTAELPPIATKVASLFPEMMPGDFKPPGVLLLEQLGEQTRARQGNVGSASSPQKAAAPGLKGGGLAAMFQAPATAKRPRDGNVTAETAQKKPRRAAPPGDSVDASQQPPSAKKEKAKQLAAPAVQSAQLSKFFGAPRAGPETRASPPEPVVQPVEEQMQQPQVLSANAEPMQEDVRPSIDLGQLAFCPSTQPVTHIEPTQADTQPAVDLGLLAFCPAAEVVVHVEATQVERVAQPSEVARAEAEPVEQDGQAQEAPPAEAVAVEELCHEEVVTLEEDVQQLEVEAEAVQEDAQLPEVSHAEGALDKDAQPREVAYAEGEPMEVDT